MERNISIALGEIFTRLHTIRADLRPLAAARREILIQAMACLEEAEVWVVAVAKS
jgi:hypothetical protein